MITRKEQEIINLLPKICDGDTCRQAILMVDELSTLRDKIEKVNKAIEEIKGLGKEMDKVQFTKYLVPLDDVLEILKRNLGE